MSIRQLKNGETFSPDVKINGKKAVVTWSVKKDKDEKSPRYVIVTELDFTGVSPADMMKLAIRPVTIELQRQWREAAAVKGSTATTVNPFVTVNVQNAVVNAARRTADPVARATAMFAKLTPAQRLAIAATFVSAAKRTA